MEVLMKSRLLDVDVALEVTGPLRDVCYALARKIGKDVPLAYMLDGARTPHITLYQGRIPSCNLAKLRGLTREVVDKSALDVLPMETQLRVREGGNIFWCAKPHPKLSKLHEDVCEAVGYLSLGHMMPYHAQKLRDARTSVTLERTLMKYGFSCAGKLFDQHITLGRLKNPLRKDDRKNAERTLHAQTLKPTHIVVGRLGKHGDIIETLSRFELPKEGTAWKTQ
jgi:hypothetical protein